MSRTVIWPIELGDEPSTGVIRAAVRDVKQRILLIEYARVDSHYVRLDFTLE